MEKTPEQMTDDILNALRVKDAPERILIESYLTIVIEHHKKKAVTDYINEQKGSEDVEYKPSHG